MKTYTIKKRLNIISSKGRTLYDRDADVLTLAYGLSGVEFSFFGCVLTAHFKAQSGIQSKIAPMSGLKQTWEVWPMVAVFLDGEESPSRVFTVNQPEKDELIFFSMKKERHTIRIVKMTEALKTGLQLCVFSTDGEVKKARTKALPTIELIGDSITCGYGVMAQAGTDYFISEHEDPFKTYGYLAAKALKMEPAMVGFSGITAGILYEKPLAMLDIYPYTDAIYELCRKKATPKEKKTGKVASLQTLYEDFGKRLGRFKPAPWDFKAHPVKIAVINLGSNDAAAIALAKDRAAKEKEFDESYEYLIRMVREKNGKNTHIICALGDVTYYLYPNICGVVEQYQKESGDKRIYTLRLGGNVRNDLRGAANHPGVAAQEMMAKELVAFIKENGIA